MPERAIPWAAEPHTLAKLEIFRRYLGGWFPIHALGLSRHRRLIVFDGFAGPGEYLQVDGSRPDGSPAVALKTFINHRAADKMTDVEGVFVFSDSDPRCVTHLRDVVLPSIPRSEKVNVFCETREFHVVANEILDRAGDRGLAPTFAFIDPFGWSGVPMGVIARILNQKRSEVLINLNVNRLNQFIASPKDAGFDALFGTSDRPDMTSGPNGYDAVSKFYAARLRLHAKFVWTFRMRDSDNRPVYDLVFGTNDIKGLEVMKDAMWSIDPITGATFSDQAAGAGNTLFVPEPDLGPLRKQLNSAYAGKTVSIEELERFVVAETSYKKGHLKRATLIPMERDEEIEYASQTLRKKSYTYPPFSRITFRP